MNLAAVYLASPRDWGWLKWSRLDCLEASLKLLRLNAPSVQVLIFHEDYTDADKERLWRVYPRIKFEPVDFSTHKDRYKPGYRSERVGSYGYGMMCRFFCGVVQSHPLLQGFSHYMRLDDDSYLLSPLTADVLRRIEASDYTYRCSFGDEHRALWAFALDFMRRHQIPIPDGLDYSESVPYTNYHTASLKLWRHPVVQQFMADIEAADGCITKGWDDAVVQGVMVRLMFPAMGMKAHREQGFCYRHNQHCSHRPGTSHGALCKDGNDAHHHGDINQQWGPPANL